MTPVSLRCTINGVRQVADNVYLLSFEAPSISSTIKAGQFLSIRVDESSDPLLRRPFSVYWTDGGAVEIIFNVIGRGTVQLRRKRPGETIEVIGPLGTPFKLSGSEFSTGILIGGGLGVAPLPLVTKGLAAAGKRIETYIGARSGRHLALSHLSNVHVATDDGTEGLHGTVVDLFSKMYSAAGYPSPKIFACGPTPMLRALAAFVHAKNIPCEVSLEGPMGCGIGICQGCPVELEGEGKKYALMCKDGPTFDITRVRL